jgi:hypothetical protein
MGEARPMQSFRDKCFYQRYDRSFTGIVGSLIVCVRLEGHGPMVEKFGMLL